MAKADDIVALLADLSATEKLCNRLAGDASDILDRAALAYVSTSLARARRTIVALADVPAKTSS